MRIGIIATSLIRRAQTGGMATYTHQLIRHLAAFNEKLQLTLFLHPQNKETFAIQHPNVKIVIVALPPRQAQFWEQLILPFILLRYRNDLDLVHAVAYAPPIVCPLFSVATLLDLTYRRVPSRRGIAADFYWKGIAETAQQRANQIIAISENSKKDVISTLQIAAEKISVTHLAADRSFQPIQLEIAHANIIAYHAGLSTPYLLFVSSLDPHKNLEGLIQAYYLAREAGIAQNLVIVGQKGLFYEKTLLPLVKRLKLENNILFLGRVPFEILPALYSAADALLFPSLYEGFGLPVLEAMSCGTPVLTSDNSSLAEVSGDAALLIDPNDVNAIAQGVISLCQNVELRRELSKRGLARAKLFSWERCAKETMEVYKKVVSNG